MKFNLIFILIAVVFLGCKKQTIDMAHEWNGIVDGGTYATNIADEPTITVYYPKTTSGEIADSTKFMAYFDGYEMVFSYDVSNHNALLVYTKIPKPQNEQTVFGSLESGKNGDFNFHIIDDRNILAAENNGLPTHIIEFSLQ